MIDGERDGASSATLSTTRRPDPDARVVAIIGARHFLGMELIKRLEEDSRYDKVLALDLCKPDLPLEKTEFHPIDLTLPTVDGQLARLLSHHGVDTVVHAAFLAQPTHASDWAHELEDVGTMHILNACAAVVPTRFILCSTTMVYGASPQNPNFLGEDAELKGQAESRFINDKVCAERQVQRFMREHPATQVCVLRYAPLLGPTVTNLFTRFFSRPIAPVMMGYDPLLQLIHERDAAIALKMAVDRDCEGVFNIVGKGVLPYTTVLALMGKLPLPMPHFLARPLSRALWATQIFDAPPSFLDFLRYLCVADGAKASRELGFAPLLSIKRTVLDFLGVGTGDEGAPDVARAQG